MSELRCVHGMVAGWCSHGCRRPLSIECWYRACCPGATLERFHLVNKGQRLYWARGKFCCAGCAERRLWGAAR